MSHYQYMVRASSIAAFFDCPSRWAAIHLDGQHLPSSPPAAIGSAVHASTAEFDRSRLDPNEARWLSADDTADIVVELIREPQFEVNWAGVNPEKALEIGLGCHTSYCYKIAPEQNYVAVESTMEQLDVHIPVDGDMVTLSLTGTLDRMYEDAYEYREEGIPLIKQLYGISDVKTGARALSTEPGRHKAQLGVYELLARHSTGKAIDLPGQILALQTGSKYGAAVKSVENCTGVLVGGPAHKGLLEHMAAMIKHGDFYGNAMSWLCSERYCPAWATCNWR